VTVCALVSVSGRFSSITTTSSVTESIQEQWDIFWSIKNAYNGK